MAGRFGRIPLDTIIAEWEDGHPINPRMLAGEVAVLLRSLAPTDRPILEAYASAILTAAPGGCTVTHGALADYFDSASLGKPAATISTSAGPFPVAAVLIWRQWINTLADQATKSAAFVAGLALPANDSTSAAAVANGLPAARQIGQPLPPSGSEPGYQKMRQAQQRREGERSAAEQLDAEKAARQRAELLANELRARLDAKDAQVSQLREEAEELRRELSDARRAKQEAEDEMIGMEEQLEAAMVFAECLRVDNKVSPPELRLAFQCWREITHDGTHNPAGPGGRGIHGMVLAWLADGGRALNQEAKARLCAVVSWRKRGSGAIRSR